MSSEWMDKKKFIDCKCFPAIGVEWWSKTKTYSVHTPHEIKLIVFKCKKKNCTFYDTKGLLLAVVLIIVLQIVSALYKFYSST